MMVTIFFMEKKETISYMVTQVTIRWKEEMEMILSAVEMEMTP